MPVDLLLEALAYHSDPGTVDASMSRFRKRSGAQERQDIIPQWAPGYMSFLSSSGGHYYEFSPNRQTATKARNDGTIQSIRASEPLEAGKTHTFAFRVDKWQVRCCGRVSAQQIYCRRTRVPCSVLTCVGAAVWIAGRRYRCRVWRRLRLKAGMAAAK